MTNESSKLWIIGNLAFLSVAIILVIIYALLSFLSLRKLLAVKHEPVHSARELKIIFWYSVVVLNTMCVFRQLFGWSDTFTSALSIRYLEEGLEVIYRFIFTFILLNTIFIVQTVLIMAKGNGKANVDWVRYYSAVATLIPLSIMRSSWIVYKFYGSMNGAMMKFDLKNTETARNLTINATSGYVFKVVGAIYNAYALYEFIIRISLSIVLGFLLWDVGQLMQKKHSLKTIRKYKLKEWAFFIICCILISLIIVYQGLGNIKHQSLDKPVWWHGFVYDFLSQKKPKNIPSSSQLVSSYDIFVITTALLTTSVLTLLAPCRNVMKK